MPWGHIGNPIKQARQRLLQIISSQYQKGIEATYQQLVYVNKLESLSKHSSTVQN